MVVDYVGEIHLRYGGKFPFSVDESTLITFSPRIYATWPRERCGIAISNSQPAIGCTKLTTVELSSARRRLSGSGISSVIVARMLTTSVAATRPSAAPHARSSQPKSEV